MITYSLVYIEDVDKYPEEFDLIVSTGCLEDLKKEARDDMLENKGRLTYKYYVRAIGIDKLFDK